MGYMKSKNLNPEDFTFKMLSVEKDVAQVSVNWKKRASRLRGGDGMSRELLIDLKEGKVIKEVWPQ
jgi:hypothetical protein